MPQMPDTTSPIKSIGKGWFTVRVLALVITPIALGLTLFAPSLGAQNSGDLNCSDFDTPAEAQAVLVQDPSDPNNLDADDDGRACEQPGEDGGDGDDGTEDNGAGSDQYDEGTSQAPVDSNGQPLHQNPNTGGLPLLPVGAGLVAWSAVGLSLLSRHA